MASSTTIPIVRARPDPRWYAIEEAQMVMEGSPALTTATTMPQLKSKANSLLRLIQDNASSGIQQQLINDHFPGFKERDYQDVVRNTHQQIIKVNEHYTRVMKFELSPNDYYSLNSANLVLYLQAVTAAGGTTAIMTTHTTMVEAFWGRFITSVKVKKQGNVNVLNVNSDDVLTQYNLFLNSCDPEYLEWNIDLLTTNSRHQVKEKSKHAFGTAETNDSITKRIELFSDKLKATNSSFVIPLRSLCNVFEIDTLPPECTFTIEFGVNQNPLQLFDYKSTSTAESDVQAHMRFVKAPELQINLVEQTSSHQIAFEQIFNKYQSYILWEGWSWDSRSKELASGVSEAEITFAPNIIQYKWLELSLMDTDAVQRPNHFCNYDHDPIMQKIKKIKITGLLSSTVNKELTYDFRPCQEYFSRRATNRTP